MVETFGAASHAEVLQLVVQIALLLAAARLFGGISQRLGQPAVVGEILAGVVLGPTLLSRLIPAVGQWVVPQTQVQGHLLEVVSLIGVMLLLVVTGFETDLGLIRRRFRVSLGIAVGELPVTFFSGFLLGWYLPADLLSDPAQRTVFALFVATALSISAIPVLAKVLMDLGLMRREIGQTMLATGLIDDLTGWTLLGIVTALAGAASLSPSTVLITVVQVLVFVLATATIGRWLVDKSLSLVQDRFRGPDLELTLVIVMAFGWGAFSQALNLEPVIGAFAIGILFGRLPRLPVDAVHKLESMALAVFAPIFFAVVGLKVDFVAILEPRLLAITLVVILVATTGKVVGAYAGARLLSGQGHWPALAYGAGLNARGALEIIIATIGLSLGILSSEMFSIIVVMAVVTSLMAPFGLRFCLRRIEPEADEVRRMTREDALRETFTAGIRRLLIPVRPRPELVGTQRIQALISRRLAETHGTSTMLLASADPASRDVATRYLSRLGDLFDHSDLSTRVVGGTDPVSAILAEAANGYDLLMIGAPTMGSDSGSLFGPVLDDLVKLAPCPTVVVRADAVPDEWVPTRILVPTDGSPGSRRTLDLAFSIAGSEVQVTAVHVVTPSRSGIRTDLAQDITTEIDAVATRLGHSISTTVIEATDVETGILRAVETTKADLLVLGTSVRAGTSRLHLGPRVEYLARHSPCPVIILNA